MADTPPNVKIETVPKSVFASASFIWIIPIMALAVALWVAWQNFSSKGPLITVDFLEGAGIAAEQTELKYRDITVGLVEDVGFSEDLKTVRATIRVSKEIAPFIDQAAKFWVVRPELSARGVSGLDTVIGGVFIEGSWDTESVNPTREFSGLANPPLFRAGEAGLQIALRTTPNGSLTENSPIVFRGVEIGRVGKARISPVGNYAVAEAIINAPHDRLITTSTRFWDTSGFDVSIGPGGAEIDFSSLASLVGGGITFDTFVSGGTRVSDGTVFEVFPDQADARDSVFNAPLVEGLKLSLVFRDNIAGLSVGAPVELNGIQIGEVQSVGGIISANDAGDERVRLNAIVDIQPAKMGLAGEVSQQAALSFLRDRVQDGLRARLASGNLLTGGLKVEFIDAEDEPETQMRIVDGQTPIMPTTQSDISDAAANIEGVFSRVNNLPIEEVLNSAITFLDSARVLTSSQGLREAPAEIQGLLVDLRGLVTSDEIQNTPVLLNASLTRLEAILDHVEREQTVAKLLSAVDAATKAAASADTAIAEIPALLESLNAVARKAETLPIDALIADLAELTKTVDAVFGTDDFAALPRSLSATLAEVEFALKELREGGVVENVNATLSSARQAADAAAGSVQSLPDLTDRLSNLLVQAGQTLQGYDNGRSLSADAEGALRDIQQAAKAITDLARTLQRNPSALIRGR